MPILSLTSSDIPYFHRDYSELRYFVMMILAPSKAELELSISPKLVFKILVHAGVLSLVGYGLSGIPAHDVDYMNLLPLEDNLLVFEMAEVYMQLFSRDHRDIVDRYLGVYLIQ